MGELFDPTLLNPDWVYLALIVGLWIGITAIYIPGTGVPEVIALVTLGGAIFMLMQLPTNWIALLLIAIGVIAFLLAPFITPRWARFAPIGLIPQGIGSVFLFSDRWVSLPLVIIVLLIALLYHQFILIPIMRHQQKRRDDLKATMIGKMGRVVSALTPVGTVQIDGELWTARATDAIEADVMVTVTQQQGLELQVVKAKRHDPQH